MNIWVILTGAGVFSALFTVLVFAASKDTESAAYIHNCPPDIRDEYFRTHGKTDVSYRSKKVILTKTAGLIFFVAVLTLIARLAGAGTFLQGFLTAFILMVWIGAYDTFFLDWVLFANMKRFRIHGTEHMDKAYYQKWFHLRGMLFPGILFGAAAASVTGLVVMLLP